MSPLMISLIVFSATVVCFFSGKFSLGLIGLTASVLLQVFGVLDSATVWGNFTNSSVVMFAALFVLSAGLMKTSLISRIVERLSGMQGNDRKVLWGCLTITIILSVLMNATAANATMIPMIMLICDRSGVNPRKVIKPCCDAANMWVGALPIGIGASAYLTSNQMIQQMGGTVEMGILDQTIFKLPALLAVTAYFYLIGSKFLPNEFPSKETAAVSMAETKKSELNATKEMLTYVIFFGVVVCMVAGSLLKWSVPTFLMPVIGGILMVFCGILTPREANKSIPLNMILLIGGMMNVAGALGSTGGAALIGDFVTGILGGSDNSMLIMAVLFAIPAFCTQFMNNIPVAQAFSPIAIASCMAVGADPRLGMMAVSFAATASILTPMASVAQSMAMEPGQYKFTDYLKYSTIPLVLYGIVFVVWGEIAAKLVW